jgi:spore coat protein CotH
MDESAGSPEIWEEWEEGSDATETEVSDWIFSLEKIHTLEVRLGDAGHDALLASPYTSVLVDIVYDGIPMESVGMRLRGKYGSFRTIDQKPKIALDFNIFTPKQRFYGLESLSFNNSVVDCSYLKDPLGYRLFGMAGVPPLRTGFARILIDGADYGLYVVLETPDDRYLSRMFPEDYGNLYDGKYVYLPPSYILIDFRADVQDYFQLEEGVEVGHVDIHAVTSAISANTGQPSWYSEVGKVVNWQEYHRELVAEQLTGHNDGYALNTNNYRVYFNPEDGQAWLLPFDLDYAFLEDSWWGMNWATPRGVLAAGCFIDATCVENHKQVAREILGAWDVAQAEAWADTMINLIYNDTQNDPRRECAAADVGPSQAYVRGWAAARGPYLQSFWGL